MGILAEMVQQPTFYSIEFPRVSARIYYLYKYMRVTVSICSHVYIYIYIYIVQFDGDSNSVKSS